MNELKADNRPRPISKTELIERMKLLELNEGQLKEIEAIANGEASQYQLATLVLEFLKGATNPKSQMQYKAGILVIFLIAIGMICWLFPDVDQAWALVGTLIGFVFGQNSKVLNI